MCQKGSDFRKADLRNRQRKGKHFAKSVVWVEKHFAILAVLNRKDFAILAVFGEKNFAKNAMLYTKGYQKDVVVTCLPVYYTPLL